jgi:FAD/FMN-containing dehydrogenase
MHPLGVVGALGEETVGEFAGALTGELVGPDDERYDGARDVWNGLINRYPALIARVADSADVATAVEFARENDLPLSVRSGAHNQAGTAIAERGVVVDVQDIDHVDVDTEQGVANVGPGNTTADALAATQEHGLAFPAAPAVSESRARPSVVGSAGFVANTGWRSTRSGGSNW